MLIQQRLATTKKIDGGITPSKIMLYELNDSIDTEVQSILLPTAVGFNVDDLPTTYPGNLSYHYVIDETRAVQTVLDTNQALSLGSGVSQGSVTDAGIIAIGIVTGSNPGGDIYSASYLARLASFVADRLYNVLEYSGGSGMFAIVNKVLFRTDHFNGLDQEAFLDLTSAALDELVTPTTPDFADLGGQVIADGDSVTVTAGTFTPPVGVSMLVPPTLYAGTGDSIMLRPNAWAVVAWPDFAEGIGFVPVYRGTAD